MELKEKRLALIEETAKHFNINNRAYVPHSSTNGTCIYSPIEGKSEGCAVGRLIKDKDLCRKMDKFNTVIDDDCLKEFIPREVSDFGIPFLASLQHLHDCKDNWDEKGLTEKGLEVMEEIKNKHCN